MRTTGEKDTYEWWYFDTHLDDGSSLVVVFYTKPFIEGVGKGLAPFVSVELDRPGGLHRQWEAKADVAGFHAATDGCDVTIGPNTFRNVEWGEPLKYRIHVEEGPLLLDIDLTGQVPPWRPGTGYMYFGDQDEHFFAWLPSVPQGSVVVDLVLDGVQETLTGVGYHDHNWGDVAMTKLINHWYWGRAQAGAARITRRLSGRSSARSPGRPRPPASASAPPSPPSAGGPSGTTCWTAARWTASTPSRSRSRYPVPQRPAASRRCSARSAPGGPARTCPSACCGTGCCSRPPTCAVPAPARPAGCTSRTWTCIWTTSTPACTARAARGRGTIRPEILDKP